VKLADPNAYYADRAVEHTAQGDIYAGIPLVQATHADPSFQAAGARKRPGGPDPDHSTSVAFTGLAIVLHYTCGFTAQPPGTRGYSHGHRLMAPIVSLRELRRWGMGNNELRKIRDGGTIQGEPGDARCGARAGAAGPARLRADGQRPPSEERRECDKGRARSGPSKGQALEGTSRAADR
jgi:hypothetical protein